MDVVNIHTHRHIDVFIYPHISSMRMMSNDMSLLSPHFDASGSLDLRNRGVISDKETEARISSRRIRLGEGWIISLEVLMDTSAISHQVT